MVSSYKVDAYLLTPYFFEAKFASATVLSDAVFCEATFFGGSLYSVNSCEADAYLLWKHSAITEASEWRWRDSNS